MMKLKQFVLGCLCVLILVSTAGCALIFEPETDAIKQMFSVMQRGDNKPALAMCDNEQVCNQLNQLISVVSSDSYGQQRNFYTIDSVEVVDETGYHYVQVSILIPVAANGKPKMVPVVFEMERVKLNWKIYSADGLDEYLRLAKKGLGGR